MLRQFLRFHLILLMVGVFACQNKRIPTKSAKSGSFNDNDVLEIYTKAYHVNDSITQIYYAISNKNLIYRRADTGSSVYARINIKYQLFGDPSNRNLIDSASLNVYDVVLGEVPEKFLKGFFIVRQKPGYLNYLELDLVDWNKKVKYLHYLKINKSDRACAENYLIRKNREVQVQNHFLKGDTLQIETRRVADERLMAAHLKNDFPIALPPFVLQQANPLKYIPDSTFSISLSQHQFTLCMPGAGFVHIKNSYTKAFEGLTLYTYDETFPGVSNTSEMIGCSRYIMNKQEFETCKTSKNGKEAIDNFWIGLGGSQERAKRLLKSYYGRVQIANRDYTAYHQGWKTDRGMIYIVFGEPSRVYRSKNGELWIYGQDSSPGALKFSFNHTNNPYTTNDYILERSEFFKEAWYSAVDQWRQGHVYTNNIH